MVEKPSRNAERSVLEMFGPEGNFEDYWLGNPPGTNSFMDEDQSGWVSAELIVRDMRRREFETERPDDAMYESMMRTKGEPGGGVIGLDEVYRPILASAIKMGAMSRQAERQRARRR
jgi:hypothetical protein